MSTHVGNQKRHLWPGFIHHLLEVMRGNAQPVAHGSELLEFDVVLQAEKKITPKSQ